MKALRIVQIILLLALVGYLFWINTSGQWISLPYLIDLPVGIVLGAGIFLGWLVGWFFGQMGTWSKNRELSRLKKRVAELEKQEPRVTAVNISRDSETPVIPDRTVASTNPRATSEYENL